MLIKRNSQSGSFLRLEVQLSNNTSDLFRLCQNSGLSLVLVQNVSAG